MSYLSGLPSWMPRMAFFDDAPAQLRPKQDSVRFVK